MTPLRKPPMQARRLGAARHATPAAPRPVPSHADGDSRLTAEEYAAWLLPPQPREGIERVVHALSLGAGVIAVTGGVGALWWIL
ncbi:MAG: hypothetical protein ABW173_11450 [Sphingomonas sp.]